MPPKSPDQQAFVALMRRWVEEIHLEPGYARTWSVNMRAAFMEWLAERHPGSEALFDRACKEWWWWKTFHDEFPKFKIRGRTTGSKPVVLTNFEVIPEKTILGPKIYETCEHCGRHGAVRTQRPAPTLEELRKMISESLEPASVVPGTDRLVFADKEFEATLRQKVTRLKRRADSLCRILGIEELEDAPDGDPDLG